MIVLKKCVKIVPPFIISLSTWITVRLLYVIGVTRAARSAIPQHSRHLHFVEFAMNFYSGRCKANIARDTCAKKMRIGTLTVVGRRRCIIQSLVLLLLCLYLISISIVLTNTCRVCIRYRFINKKIVGVYWNFAIR